VPPGLYRRGEIWHLQKRFGGRRIRESTGTSDLTEAEKYLVHRMEGIRQEEVYGVPRKRIFREAETKYLNEAEKITLAKDAWSLKRIDAFIGDLPLDSIHMGTLRPYIEHGRRKGWKNRTINMPLEVVRRILNLAAGEWIDETGQTWLRSAPKIRLLTRSDAREPYPLSWEEQERMFDALPEHLRRMCLFSVNTGLRNGEICGLRWDWEVPIPPLATSVFVIPKEHVKNREDRLVVLNHFAEDIVRLQRGLSSEWVFTYKGAPLKTMNTTAWKKARERVGLKHVRIHDLRHTWGRRLRSAGVSFEDRQDLLGHKSGRITTHYSMPELENLIEAANKVCHKDGHKMATMVVLRKKIPLRLVSNRAG